MVTRRSALHASGVVLGLGIAGCNTASIDDPDTTPSPETSPTATSTMTRSSPRPEDLKFEAHVVQQQTAEAPARVRARLQNVGPPLQVGFGPALLFTDESSPRTDGTEELVIDPETYIGPWDEPTQTEDGCWRFPRGGQRAVQSLLEGRDLAPGKAITETYDVYTHGDSGPCLPEGTYRFHDRGYVEKDSNPMVLTLVLTVDANGQLSASTEGPTFP